MLTNWYLIGYSIHFADGRTTRGEAEAPGETPEKAIRSFSSFIKRHHSGVEDVTCTASGPIPEPASRTSGAKGTLSSGRYGSA